MTTSVSPNARQMWRVARTPVLILGLFIAVGVVVALVSRSSGGGALDPRSPTPGGSLALARLLEERGVTVDRQSDLEGARSALGGSSATLFVTRPDLLPPKMLETLAAKADELVLIAPTASIEKLLPDVEVAEYADEEVRSPGCSLDDASAAGAATMGGVAYQASDAVECYRSSDGATLVRAQVSGTSVTLVGTPTPFTNRELDEEGNAALAMRLLGTHNRLVWYTPTPGDPAAAGGDQSLVDLLPAGWKFGLIQLAIAGALVALWRARRLGPVVVEPLPVVVRAAETTEGRANLYHRARAAEHAAESLRAAARSRIGARLGLTSDAEPDAVASAAAGRTGRQAAEVHDLLYGPAPTDDADLVRFAGSLDALENEVRQA